MSEKVHIPKPCPADWQQMTPCNNGRFCGSCQKVVVDFTDKTLDEIQGYLKSQSGERICGLYHERHTAVSNRWYDILNYIEGALTKVRLQRLAVLLVGVLLFISGCKSGRRTQGEPAVPYTTKLSQDLDTNKMHKSPHE